MSTEQTAGALTIAKSTMPTAVPVAAPVIGRTAITMEALIMDPQRFDVVERAAKLMASNRCIVPEHLKGDSAGCFAIILQAAQWGMNPFAVAQKTHIVQGTLGYESQLVHAALESMGAIKDTFKYEFFGPWENVIGKFIEKTSEKSGKKYIVPGWKMEDEKGCGVRVTATPSKGDGPETLELLLSQAGTRNSTLWGSNPQQQLGYLAVKYWARRYCPGALLGVYTEDELEGAINITPEAGPPPQSEMKPGASKLAARLGVGKPQESPASPAPQEEPPPVEEGKTDYVTKEQRSELQASVKGTLVTKEAYTSGLRALFNYNSPEEIKKTDFDRILKWVKAGCKELSSELPGI